MPKTTTSPGMQATAAKMLETFENVRREATTLNTFVLNTYWVGTAGPKFKSAMEAWNQQFSVVASHLDEMANYLSSGASDIENAEYENAATGNFFTPSQ